MRLVDVIRKKRDGNELSPEEIQFVVRGYTAGELPDYQISAWLMAVFLQGMTRDETAALTAAMLNSGEKLDWSSFPKPKVDKHSTGGVGDKTSMILAPLAASGGLLVPMISGRGLGHTGGTLDKLESIPGFRVHLSPAEMRRVIAGCGVCIVGQTSALAPADKKIYALRDVTATVESPALICGSIMSKKLAEGIDSLVLDIKVGSGAFLKEDVSAASVARLMVETGEQIGKRVVALLTNMDQPLGRAVGNALEIAECVEVLRGGGPTDLVDLSIELSAWMFYLGSRSETVEEGRELASRLIAAGNALETFFEMVRLQGGDVGSLENTSRLPVACGHRDVESPTAGYVTDMNTENIGRASLVLGGGRATREDAIDPAVGITVRKKVGDRVEVGEPLCTLHYNVMARLEEAYILTLSTYSFGNSPPTQTRPLIRRVLSNAAPSETGVRP